MFAANRILKLQRKNAMYRQSTFRDYFNNFEFKKKLSFSSFYKYIPKFIKKPQRLTDLCSFCQLLKVKRQN